jgi:hypothetical protein
LCTVFSQRRVVVTFEYGLCQLADDRLIIDHKDLPGCRVFLIQ